MGQWVLATDLDGTFLGGSRAQREALYRFVAARRRTITLIYATGRSLASVREVIAGLPPDVHPDHVVTDVGTSASSWPTCEPLSLVEAWLENNWTTDAPSRIEAALRPHTHLEPLANVAGRRSSYRYRDLDRTLQAKRDVEAAGFDGLISHNSYFDVLPRGVSKGPTLLQLLTALSLPLDRVLVAGDSLNDLSLFETGLRGVAVSNSEPQLLSAVRDMPNVHASQEPGAAAVLQALRWMLDGA